MHFQYLVFVVIFGATQSLPLTQDDELLKVLRELSHLKEKTLENTAHTGDETIEISRTLQTLGGPMKVTYLTKRSSWDSYVDRMIAQSNENLDGGAIIGQDGSKWTTQCPKCIVLEPAEVQAIINAFKSKDFTSFMTAGINIAKVRYQFLREMDGTIVLGKKKGNGAITLQTSKTAVVIGHTAEGKLQGSGNEGVAMIAEYLITLGM